MQPTIDLALLLLRAVVGGLLAGHGAQKLFGAYGGPGVEGTTRMMGGLGLQPARPMALAAGASELGGGALTAAGLLGPFGPLAGIGAMSVAATTAHAGKPIWATKGGAELPVTNLAVLAALLVAGNGRLALDRILGIRVPAWLAIPGLAGVVVAMTAARTGGGEGEERGPASDQDATRIAAGEHEGKAVVLPTEPGPGPATGPALPVDGEGTGTTDQGDGATASGDVGGLTVPDATTGKGEATPGTDRPAREGDDLAER
ncbi:MAG: DoxX family protein [Chloroflexota bacterium]